jgi:type IV pilus assembly protein PilA
MFCTTCGTQNPEQARFCTNCGQPLAPAANMAPPPPIPPPPATGVPTATDARNDGKAVASLILGICSLTILSILAGIPAVILGHMSRSDIRKSMGRLKGDGLALAGLIMGYLSLLAIPVILIIAAIAIPNLLRSRMAANEASAVGSMRAVVTASETYKDAYGSYAPTFSALACETGEEATAEHACLIEEFLSRGTKSGYRFTYAGRDDDNDGKPDGYFIEAEPLSPGSSGRSTFCTDQTGVIRKESSGSQCSEESPALM